MKQPDLPIREALPDLLDALRARRVAVLQAPPGAGKTTVVPLAMLAAGLCAGRILMLEPRRLAARAAAERMAETLGEQVGQSVGYRMRGEVRVTDATRIEVVTEGILTRMIQSDPTLEGVGAVIFDEFHERSLNADLGLALVWEARGALRDDLLVVVMSATLDGEPIAALLDAPIITSHGRAFPVETRWLDRPIAKTARFERSVADLVANAVAETQGGVLVFLPGEGEIRRVETALQGRLPANAVVRPLFGAMKFADQRAAVTPADQGRKVVLATSIAETSLTIQDIRVVVDAGRARRARFDPGSGMTRLVTERVTRAEAEQRRGRAGRVAEGICYRMWTRAEEGGMQAFPPAEIEAADLTGLALELALWGAQANQLAFLSPPNPGALTEASALLTGLGALDQDGRITAQGKRLARLPLHPRLAHMVLQGGKDAALLAALLAERDPMQGAGIDILLRKRAAQEGDKPFARIRAEARRLAKMAGPESGASWAELLAMAFPDRIGRRRQGTAPRYVLSGGKGAVIDDADPLAGASLIVAADLDGDAREARVRLGAAITETEVRNVLGNRIFWQDSCHWDKRSRRVVARRQERLGAVVLAEQAWNDPGDAALARAALQGIRQLGLPWNDAARRFQARVQHAGSEMPDFSDAGLIDSADEWLLPHLGGARTETDLRNLDLLPALQQRLNWDQMKAVDRAAPKHYVTPMGRKIAIDYSGQVPAVSLRLQELFGVTRHPMIAGQALLMTLLSPAGRPVQVTQDLPGFWASSYADVRKDMRGRYPKHPWPEDPTMAQPTLRAKKRSN